MWEWRRSTEIDPTEWDSMIDQSLNPKIEYYSWYLNAVSNKWGAFFLNNFESAIPVAYRSIMHFLDCAHRPPFSQRTETINQKILATHQELSLFQCVQKHFPCGTFSSIYSHDQTWRRTNLTIPLSEYRNNGTLSYTTHHKRRVKKSLSQGLHIDMQVKRLEFLHWISEFQKKNGKISGLDFNALLRLSLELEQRKLLRIVAARNEHSMIIAIGLYSDNGKRLVNLLSLSNPEGKKKIAMYGIVHSILQNIQDTHEIFDFEGSDLPGVRQFYQGFGPQIDPYFEINWNHHWLCKLQQSFRKWKL